MPLSSSSPCSSDTPLEVQKLFLKICRFRKPNRPDGSTVPTPRPSSPRQTPARRHTSEAARPFSSIFSLPIFIPSLAPSERLPHVIPASSLVAASAPVMADDPPPGKVEVVEPCKLLSIGSLYPAAQASSSLAFMYSSPYRSNTYSTRLPLPITSPAQTCHGRRGLPPRPSSRLQVNLDHDATLRLVLAGKPRRVQCERTHVIPLHAARPAHVCRRKSLPL